MLFITSSEIRYFLKPDKKPNCHIAIKLLPLTVYSDNKLWSHSIPIQLTNNTQEINQGTKL